MKRYLVVAALMIVPLYGLSRATEEIVKSMVPHGEISRKIGKDYSVKTQSGTKVMIEFDHAGNLDEASGLNLGTGDIFEPGNGLITLGSAAQLLKGAGHNVKGEWRLEHDPKYKWIYELESLTNDEKNDFLVDAKSGKLIKTVE
jgi:uncharacterized membrane protein YkoI